MIQILLVEDEPLMREAIQAILPWEQHGFQIAAVAQNGAEALDILDRQKVDIVLTDIKMPVIDGIELLQKAKAHMTRTAFVMLSSYDEFKLVNSAYKLGAKDYILKSEITEEQVVEVLQRVSKELLQMRKKQDSLEEHDHLMKVFSENILTIRRRRLEEILEGRYTLHQLLQNNDSISFRLDGDRIVVIDLLVHNQPFFRQADEKKLLQFQGSFTRQLEIMLQDRGLGNLLSRSADQYVLLFGFAPTISTHDIKAALRQLYLDLKVLIEKQFDVRLSGGMSSIGKNLETAPMLYDQAIDACCQYFVQGNDQLLYHPDFFSNQRAEPLLAADRSKQLKSVLLAMDSAAIKADAKHYRIKATHVDMAGIGILKRIFDNYFTCIQECSESMMVEQELLAVLKAYQQDLGRYCDLGLLNDWLSWAMNSYAEAIDNGSFIINRAKQTIHKRFQNHLSLTGIADEIGVNSSYLSRLFNKKVGCTFMDYLSRVRMDAALEYFRNSNLKIFEVAEKVGYSNPEHFSRVFKKYFYKSPKDFIG